MESNAARHLPTTVTGIEITRIDGDENEAGRDDRIFRALGDRYSEAIIVLTIAAPRTALELIQIVSFPTAACYRRLAALCNAGLLKVEGFADGPRGKITRIYRSCVKRLTYDISEHGAVLVVQFVGGERKRFAVSPGRPAPVPETA